MSRTSTFPQSRVAFICDKIDFYSDLTITRNCDLRRCSQIALYLSQPDDMEHVSQRQYLRDELSQNKFGDKSGHIITPIRAVSRRKSTNS